MRKIRILIVDDEPEILSLTSEVLMLRGYEIITAKDGKSAFDIFSKDRDKIDLIITDIIMPNMDGKMLMESIHKIKPEMKFLFVSGYSENILGKKGISVNDDIFIQKPWTIDKLLKKINIIISKV